MEDISDKIGLCLKRALAILCIFEKSPSINHSLSQQMLMEGIFDKIGLFFENNPCSVGSF